MSSFEGNESPIESLPLRQFDEKCILDGDIVFIAVSYKNASGLMNIKAIIQILEKNIIQNVFALFVCIHLFQIHLLMKMILE